MRVLANDHCDDIVVDEEEDGARLVCVERGTHAADVAVHGLAVALKHKHQAVRCVAHTHHKLCVVLDDRVSAHCSGLSTQL